MNVFAKKTFILIESACSIKMEAIFGIQIMFEIHPLAKKNFNSKAEQLITLIIAHPREVKSSEEFNSDIVAAKITEDDIIGSLREGISDQKGNTIGRFFSFDGERYGLINSAHFELVKLAEAIQRLPTFRNKLSQVFIEEILFSWLERRFIRKFDEKNFIETLVEEASSVVKPLTVIIPLANTIVEVEFRFCGAVIKNISKSMVDKMANSGNYIDNEKNKKNFHIFIEDFRKQYQGYAGIEIRLECEPDYASKSSLNIANKITDLLGIYSGSSLIPEIKCVSRAKGSENIAEYTTICMSERGDLNIIKGLLEPASAKNWFISKQDLNNYMQCGLGIISEISTKDKTSDFESTVLNMALLYSKSAFTSDPLEKLVYMLSSLEATLLKSENEPIQQNIAERMAIFVTKKLEERKEIIKNLKTVYDLRSRYLHHGHSSNELVELSKFFFNVWLFYVQLILNVKKFKDKKEFLNAIDDQKLS